jgi:hypothetical protein
LIGGNIANVAAQSFSGMASGVISGIGNAVMSNPMDIIKPAMALAIPSMAIMGGMRMIPSLLMKGFEGGAFARIGNKMSSAL